MKDMKYKEALSIIKKAPIKCENEWVWERTVIYHILNDE